MAVPAQDDANSAARAQRHAARLRAKERRWPWRWFVGGVAPGIAYFITWPVHPQWYLLAVVVVATCVGARRWRNGVSFGLGALAPVVVGIGLFLAPVIGGAIGEWLSKTKFDAAAWHADATRESNGAVGGDPPLTTRQHMVDDLIDRGLLIGLTREQVTVMLGPPDQENPEHPPYPAQHDYYLGVERAWIRIDGEYLGVQFDRTWKVTRAFVWRS